MGGKINPTHEERLQEAARRYGKPWRCGPVGHTREVFVRARGRYIVVPTTDSATTDNVADLRRRRA